MKFFAVTGKPILFSKSPDIFNSFFKQHGVEAKYFRMAAQTAQEAVAFFKTLGLSGMNVTAPFKEGIIPFLDDIDARAKAIGSVNTVVNKGGQLYGYNTDYDGIVDTLQDISGKKVLLLGAGGAAKAVSYAVKQMGADLCIYNRTASKAQVLAEYFKSSYSSQRDLQKAVEASHVIINTLPAGIKVLEDDWLKSEQIIFDAVYHNSVYQPVAKDKSMRFYSGEDWLINQAIPAYQLFFDVDHFKPKRPKLDKKLSPKVMLTGFMGSGKSVVGEQMAKAQHLKFFCTDTLISQKEQTDINQIFETQGETYFRDCEHDILKKLSAESGRAIVASGGGMVLKPSNRQIMSEHFTVFNLYASPKSVMYRVNPHNRPVLKDHFNIDFVQGLIKERMPLYLSSADLVIYTDDKSPQELSSILQTELSYLA